MQDHHLQTNLKEKESNLLTSSWRHFMKDFSVLPWTNHLMWFLTVTCPPVVFFMLGIKGSQQPSTQKGSASCLTAGMRKMAAGQPGHVITSEKATENQRDRSDLDKSSTPSSAALTSWSRPEGQRSRLCNERKSNERRRWAKLPRGRRSLQEEPEL